MLQNKMHIHHKCVYGSFLFFFLPRKRWFYFVLFFTVHRFLFIQCWGKCHNAPKGCRERAVKPRRGALWPTGSSTPKHKQYYSYIKIKTVTKCNICTNQDRLSK